ncbi:hypothetical protein CEP51_001450 [Fusarium floridanum]|uniref:Zn(2)-C6 fungal-type domain-containing protein n=1 Tax=Fusarium floridanum TaxID=1325733 RepID=A0A428SGZ5_9HYPO|nr:hypothetical protein CEP51_001450 [Fusarium floridanum]
MSPIEISSLTVVPYHGPGESARARKRRLTQGSSGNKSGTISKIRNACNSCREKKTRCSGHRPCIRCQQNGQDCQYMPTASTPHLQDTRPIAPTETNISPSGTFSPTGTYVSHPQPALDASLDPSPNRDDTQGDTPTAPLQEDQYGHLHGGSSEFAFLHFARQKLSSLPSMSINFCGYPLTSSRSLPHVLPPKPISDELIRNYFDFGLSTSRFVHQPSFQESYEQLCGLLSQCSVLHVTISECKTVSDGTFCSAAVLIHYARLARILGRILREFYRPAMKNQTISQLSEAAAEFDRLLNEWQESLPAYLNYIVLPPSALSVMTQRQMCTLKLAFAHASLLLHRPFILYSMETTLRKTSYLEDWVKRCHDKSIAAANMVVSECKYLYQRGLFTRAF